MIRMFSSPSTSEKIIYSNLIVYNVILTNSTIFSWTQQIVSKDLQLRRLTYKGWSSYECNISALMIMLSLLTLFSSLPYLSNCAILSSLSRTFVAILLTTRLGFKVGWVLESKGYAFIGDRMACLLLFQPQRVYPEPALSLWLFHHFSGSNPWAPLTN